MRICASALKPGGQEEANMFFGFILLAIGIIALLVKLDVLAGSV